MDLLLNYGFAWISVLLTFFLCSIYVLKKAIIKSNGKNTYLSSLYRTLKKHHKLVGILLVITGLVHGYFSSESILSLNFGTVAWIVSILLGLNWMARKLLSKYKGWIYYHRILTAVFLLTIVLHVVQVGGIQVHTLLLGNSTSSSQKVTVNELNKSMQGATFTSIGIMNATSDALSKALIDGTLPSNQQLPQNRGHGGGKGGGH